nr:hypothetical protein [uncultured Carboxylicivirga sp.]
MVMNKIYAILVAMLLLISCTIETGTINETVIINNSGNNVSFTAYFSHQDIVITLENGEEASETRSHDSGGAEIFPTLSDSIFIVFNDTRIAKYYNEIVPGGRSPFNIDAYNLESLGEKNHFNKYSYTYTISEEDYNNAIPIE